MKGPFFIGLACILCHAQAQENPPAELSLEEAVTYALRHSPILRSSKAEIDAARAEVGVARSKLKPQVSLNGFASRGNMANVLQSSMGVEPRALVMAPDRSFFDANLMLMAPLYTGGLYTGMIGAAAALERAAQAEANGMRAEVELMVRESYLRALYGAELAKAQESRVVAAQGMVKNSQAQLEAGKGIEASVRRAEAELADAQRELLMAENDRRKMILDLLEAMGAPLDTQVPLKEKLSYSEPSNSLESYLAASTKARGELIAVRERVRFAEGRLKSAQGSRDPQVYGFAMGDAFGPRDEMGRRTGYSFGLTVSFPLVDGGMRRSEIVAARAMLEKVKAELDQMQRRVEKEVRQAWLDIQTATQTYRTAQAALTAAQSAYEVVVVRVENGKGILVEQLDALATLNRARASVAQATFEHQLAIARINRAVGYVQGVPDGGTSK